jgi:RNA polymerase sigma-70 factor, ECF subfamily
VSRAGCRTSATDTGSAIRDLAEQREALRRYVVSLLAPDVHLAEDILQETMLRAWQHADRLDWRERPIRPWLFRIARNLVIDAWRKDRLVPVGIRAEAIAERADPADPAALVADRHMLIRGLLRIAPAHREILVQVHLLGRSGDEIARDLRIPRGTVKSRTHHALRALRQALQFDEAAA